MDKRRIGANRRLFRNARRYLVGGVNSPVRAFSYVGGQPLLIKSGRGAKVYDYEARGYIDYVLSWGALILGHRHPRMIRGLKHKIDGGLGFGATGNSEIELAAMIHHAIPFVEKIRFVNSGTEAVMAALRLARGYTGRDKILKFANSYHGHADYLLAKSGSGLATLGIPSSRGVPWDFVRHTLVGAYGEQEGLRGIFRRYDSRIAAVIVEPAGGNYGVTPPDIDFLKSLRDITREFGVLLVFDEVITAFRFGFGSLAQKLGVIPDLICLGKIIGGGLPVGAFGGESRIMNKLAPLGDVYQASTFSGNPIVMQAGLGTLEIIQQHTGGYVRTEVLTRDLIMGLKREGDLKGVALKIRHYGNMFSLSFGRKKEFRSFYRLMLEGGIYFAPSEFEANFLSFAHTENDIRKTLKVAREILTKLRR